MEIGFLGPGVRVTESFPFEHACGAGSLKESEPEHGREVAGLYEAKSRLKRKGLIRRMWRKQRYELTPLGRQVAVLFTKAYGRVLAPGLALLDPGLPEGAGRRSSLATAWRNLGRAFDDFAERSLIAA